MGMRKLHLICGEVTDLRVSKGYIDPVFGTTERATATVGALAAVAVGQALTSTVLTNASHGAEIDVEYFTCSVAGLSLSGHLHRVDFKNGDEMEFVIEKLGERGFVQGARSAVNRIVWMMPYQTRGVAAQQKNNTKWRYVTSLLCGSIPTAFFLFFLPEDKNSPFWFYPAIFLGTSLTTLVISFLITRRFNEFSVMATEVLHAFGYENPEWVDLPALNKRAEQKLRSHAPDSPIMFQPWRFHY